MKWQALMADGYSRVLSDVLEKALAGLKESNLEWQPNPDCNSIGWIVWHLTRSQDSQVADLMGKDQLWTAEGWHRKFGRQADPEDTGFGHTAADVAAFKSPPAQTLMDYYSAVFQRTKGYIVTLKAGDLDRVLDESWYQPPPSVGVRLVSIMCDCLEHAGEVAYLRGLMKGKGWLGY